MRAGRGGKAGSHLLKGARAPALDDRFVGCAFPDYADTAPKLAFLEEGKHFVIDTYPLACLLMVAWIDRLSPSIQ